MSIPKKNREKQRTKNIGSASNQPPIPAPLFRPIRPPPPLLPATLANVAKSISIPKKSREKQRTKNIGHVASVSNYPPTPAPLFLL
ncbi:hypothetical protein BDZ91DRAFT_721097 [Kalaharituber pfeilii]|nr:hypothetical protein BDZ91DRAFT_748012 [Kalaharituber pfeilii]KAF8457068.1 hypothetical protein BDZ91DRAFT_744836 [Kalaharituber pfeilii]KAF8469784.1 hypothetical protein BDZ91DRAFT_721097 [Kalaharituber pfeilii]